MTGGAIRKGVAAIVAVAVAAGIAVAALPFIASTQIVRDRIANELSMWSGYRVILDQAPSLDVWPRLTASLDDVRFEEWAPGDNPPVLTADRLDVSLSALSALLGRVVLKDVVLQRPVLTLTAPGPLVDLPASPGGGRMMRAVAVARGIVSNDPVTPDMNTMPDQAFGRVQFVDGRIEARDGESREVLTDLDGSLSWPTLSGPADLSASGIWRGETVKLRATSAEFMRLVAGGNAPIDVELTSAPLTFTFDGVANLSTASFFEGAVTASSPSLRRTLEWSRTRIAPGEAIGAVRFSARLSGSAQRLKLDGARLDIGDNAATGVLEASFDGAKPTFAGTLAFDRLDFGSFLRAFGGLVPTAQPISQRIDASIAEQIGLDLRLSAASAVLSSVPMSDVAATAQIRDDLIAFDVLDATSFGGTLTAGLKITRVGQERKTVDLRFTADEIDVAAAAATFGDARMRPSGIGSLSLTLQGRGRNWESVIGGADGKLSASLGEGAIEGFDLNDFSQKWSDGTFFALADVAQGRFAIRRGELRATVSQGVASIDTAELTLADRIVRFTGIVPYLSQALALSGSFVPLSASGDRGAPDASFFVGGAWDAPFVSPVGVEP